jgi:hypothetical protein
MALDFSRLREALNLTSKEQGAPNRTLDVRIEVRGIDNDDVGGLIWKVSSPSGGYGRNTNQAAGVLTMLAVRIADMERAVRREIATGRASEDNDNLDEAEDE